MPQHKNKLNWRFFFYSRKYFSLGVALIIAAVTIFVFATYPQVDVALSNHQLLQKEEKNLEKVRKKSIELEQVKLLPEFTQAALVDEVLPSKKPLLEIISSLNNVANTNNVTLTDFSVKPGDIASDSTKVNTQRSSSNTKYQKLDSNLAASGTIEDVENFISILERITPITTVTDISLSRSRKEGADGEEIVLAKADLSISSYFFTQSIRAAVDQPLPKIGEKEKEIFNTIQEFTPTTLDKQTTIESGNLEDIFNIDGIDIDTYEEILKEETQISEDFE